MAIGVHIPANRVHGLLHVSVEILSKKHPAENFILFTESELKDMPVNCTQVPVSPKQKNKLLRYYWYRYKPPVLLKKYSITSFITAAPLLSLKSDTDQYMLFENDILSNEKSLNRYYRKIFRASLSKAKAIFAAEDLFKSAAASVVAGGDHKIKIIYHGLDTPLPAMSYAEQEQVKETFAKGFDFFLFPVTKRSAQYLMPLLKSFSVFKKWQHSSLKLVLLLQDSEREGLIKDFHLYKHREDVLFVKDTDEVRSQLLCSAYGVIYFSEYSLHNIGLNALQAGVPLIAYDEPVNRSMFADAALYSNNDEKQLSERMMRLYKDEYERKILIQKGGALTLKYNAEAAADKIWTAITGN